jgi:hypothetical protein
VVHTEDPKDGVGEDKAVVVYVDAQWQCVKGDEGKIDSQPEGVKGKDKEAETEQEKKVRALRLSSGQVCFMSTFCQQSIDCYFWPRLVYRRFGV